MSRCTDRLLDKVVGLDVPLPRHPTDANAGELPHKLQRKPMQFRQMRLPDRGNAVDLVYHELGVQIGPDPLDPVNARKLQSFDPSVRSANHADDRVLSAGAGGSCFGKWSCLGSATSRIASEIRRSYSSVSSFGARMRPDLGSRSTMTT